MLFNSWPFIILMLFTIFVYYLKTNTRYQISILIIASSVFYSYNNISLLLLLFISAIINAVVSYYVAYGIHKRVLSILGVIINLSVLLFFKYGGLIVSLFNLSDGLGAFLVSLPLPLGISFYTFQGISLVIDVFTGKYIPSKQLVDKSLKEYVFKTIFFISFFPALIAGPILKAHDFYNQIRPKKISDVSFNFVFKTFILGYFFKMVIADNLKDFTFWMAYPYFEIRGPGSLLLMLLGYSTQIFADFAGYSLIAIASAAVFGYQLPQNFNYPYISSSIHEFWKRWHISLSSFLMEYLYIPLGGNRHGKGRTYLNLFITMLLGGLWHGAAWSYMFWGAYHGLLLLIERLFCGKRPCLIKITRHKNFSNIISIIIVYILVTLGWLLFALPNFDQVIGYLKCIFNSKLDRIFMDPKLLPIVIYMIPVFLYHLIYYLREHPIIKKYISKYSFIFYGILLYLIITNSGTTNSFIYFQF